MRISVCIPATRAGSLPEAIRSLREQTWADWEAVVVGQGGAAVEAAMRSSTAAAAAGDARVRYVHLPVRGLSRARNAGIREASGEVVAFLDDDCEADPSWLATIAAAFAEDAGLGAVGGAVIPSGPLRMLSSCPTLTPSQALYDPAMSPQSPPPGWDWIGANFALRLATAQRAGDFDVHLGAGAEFPAGEDTDYKLRLEAIGVRMLTTPRSVVRHSSGTRSGRAALRSQRNYQLGNGALAAKQTLSGDPRGRLWLSDTLRGTLTGWASSGRIHRLPIDLRRALWFEVGYRRCLRHYEVDAAGLLRPRDRGDDRTTRIDRRPAAFSPRAASSLGCLRMALALRTASAPSADRPLVLPVAGGRGGLLRARACRLLVSALDPRAVARGAGVRLWLERRQARRSALLLVPDRATGMRFAGLWGVDLARVRAVPDVQHPPLELVERWLVAAAQSGRQARPWHAV